MNRRLLSQVTPSSKKATRRNKHALQVGQHRGTSQYTSFANWRFTRRRNEIRVNPASPTPTHDAPTCTHDHLSSPEQTMATGRYSGRGQTRKRVRLIRTGILSVPAYTFFHALCSAKARQGAYLPDPNLLVPNGYLDAGQHASQQASQPASQLPASQPASKTT